MAMEYPQVQSKIYLQIRLHFPASYAFCYQSVHINSHTAPNVKTQSIPILQNPQNPGTSRENYLGNVGLRYHPSFSSLLCWLTSQLHDEQTCQKSLPSKNFPTDHWSMGPQALNQQFMKEFLSFGGLGMSGVCSKGMLGFP